MNKALVIYDNTGKIWSIVYGAQEAPQGLQSIWVDIPENAVLDSIDPVTKEPHFTYLPETDLGQLQQEMKQVSEELKEVKENGGTMPAYVPKALSFAALGFTDEQAAEVPELFDEWSPDGVTYSKGNRVRYNGVLYKYISEAPTESQETWNPADAHSLWEAIGDPDKGTKDNPVDWVSGMHPEKDKYYRDSSGVIWLCIEDPQQGLYGEPKDMARYFQKAE